MQVTKSNFNLVFPHFLSDLHECEFYSFDLEMTGINVDPQPVDVSHLPFQCPFLAMPSQLFQEKKNASTKFRVIQLGVSLFCKEKQRATTFRRTCVWPEVDQLIATCQAKLDEGVEPDVLAKQLCKTMKKTIDDFLKISLNHKDLEVLLQQSKLFELCMVMEEVVLNLNNGKPLWEDLLPLPLLPKNSVVAPNKGLPPKGTAPSIAKEEKSPSPSPPSPPPAMEPPEKEEYYVRSYSFFLFPNCHLDDRTITMDCTTVGDFLTKNYMDFNQWIYEGLPYATRETVSAIRSNAVERYVKNCDPASIQKEILASITSPGWQPKIQQLFQSMEALSLSPPTDTSKINTPFFPQDVLDAVRRKCSMIGLLHDKGTISKTSAGRTVCAVLAQHSQRSDYPGTRVFEALVGSQKPLVGHNVWSDLMFLYHTFHSTPMDSYTDMKIKIRTLLPKFFDTRTLCTMDALSDVVGRTNLGKQWEAMSAKFKKQCSFSSDDPNFSFGDSSQQHDAAYDAFLTGSLFCFARTALRERNISIDTLQSIIPVFGSVFSIDFSDVRQDWMMHPKACPVIWFQLSDKSARGVSFQNTLQHTLQKYSLPSSCMSMGHPDILAFVKATATGRNDVISNLQTAITELRKSHRFDGVVKILPVEELLEQRSGEVKYFS